MPPKKNNPHKQSTKIVSVLTRDLAFGKRADAMREIVESLKSNKIPQVMKGIISSDEVINLQRPLTQIQEMMLLDNPKFQSLSKQEQDKMRDDFTTQNSIHGPYSIYYPYDPESDDPEIEAKFPMPALIYVPGTAFMQTDDAFTDALCRQICDQSKCIVISVRTPVAPENPWPRAFDITYEIVSGVIRHYIENEQGLINSAKIGISGYSSGGNFASLIALKATKAGLPISLQILISPLTDLSRSIEEARDEEALDTIMSEDHIKHFVRSYFIGCPGKDRQDVDVSPYFALQQDLQRLPPTFTIVGKQDRVLGDARGFHKKLKFAKVDAHLYELPNAQHSLAWVDMRVPGTIAKILKHRFLSSPLLTPRAGAGGQNEGMPAFRLECMTPPNLHQYINNDENSSSSVPTHGAAAAASSGTTPTASPARSSSNEGSSSSGSDISLGSSPDTPSYVPPPNPRDALPASSASEDLQDRAAAVSAASSSSTGTLLRASSDANIVGRDDLHALIIHRNTQKLQKFETERATIAEEKAKQHQQVASALKFNHQ